VIAFNRNIRIIRGGDCLRWALSLYREATGRVPLLEWLDCLNTKARIKCLVRLERLSEIGHGIRRPEADYPRDGVYELRAKCAEVNYRMLYFFYGTTDGARQEGRVRGEPRASNV